MTDITLLTCPKYVHPHTVTPYVANILEERRLIQEALEACHLSVNCKSWDDPDYDWTQSRVLVFRTIWDYFERIDEFLPWLEAVQSQTQLINSYDLIKWNIDKHYLADLGQQGVAIVPTTFVDKGAYRSLQEICNANHWQDIVIKPAIAGGAYLTYRISIEERQEYESQWKALVAARDMLVQPFMPTITSRGEASLMVLNGRFTHAILKKAKAGDYRVQDDHGGTVHPYTASDEEKIFAEQVFRAIQPMPAYGRVDIIWSDTGQPLVSEVEIIEPELWLRFQPQAAEEFAQGILHSMKSL